MPSPISAPTSRRRQRAPRRASSTRATGSRSSGSGRCSVSAIPRGRGRGHTRRTRPRCRCRDRIARCGRGSLRGRPYDGSSPDDEIFPIAYDSLSWRHARHRLVQHRPEAAVLDRDAGGHRPGAVADLYLRVRQRPTPCHTTSSATIVRTRSEPSPPTTTRFFSASIAVTNQGPPREPQTLALPDGVAADPLVATEHRPSSVDDVAGTQRLRRALLEHGNGTLRERSTRPGFRPSPRRAVRAARRTPAPRPW